MHPEDPPVRTSGDPAEQRGPDAAGRHSIPDHLAELPWSAIARAGIVVTLVVSVVLRFWTPSALWLDEALTVNIAKAPLHSLPGLLRDDGAPPLYYFMLHFWMLVFGDGNEATRSLAGVIGVVNLPVAWVTARRVGSRWWEPDEAGAEDAASRQERGRIVAWAVMLLVASSPFVVYYDTEARMYGLEILLGTLLVFCFTSLLRRPGLAPALGLAAVVAALLYSHYWSFYVLGVFGLVVLWGAVRGPHATACRWSLAAMAVAGIAFLPWVPTLLFQERHTGTPWAVPAQLTAVIHAFTQLAGGNTDAGRGLAVIFFLLGLLAIFGLPLDAFRVVLDVRTRPGVRLVAIGVVATLTLGLVVGRLFGVTFADRYTSVLAFPALLALGYGFSALADPRVRNGLLACAVAFGLLAAVPNAFLARTGAATVGHAIEAGAEPHDVIAYCPDQLGPAVSRVIGDRYEETTFPREDGPEIVNWVDYLRVVASASPAAFAKHVEEMAGATGTVWYVWAPGYIGYGFKCQTILHDLEGWRGHRYKVVANTLKSDTPYEIYEGETLDTFRPISTPGAG